MPTVTHWGFNGSPRRYWDFLYAGKFSRVEGQLHHYGSGLNPISVLTEYRENRQDLYLQVGYGGLMVSFLILRRMDLVPADFMTYSSTLRID